MSYFTSLSTVTAQSFAAQTALSRNLPSPGIQFPELGYGGYMGIQAAVNIDDLARHILALIGGKVNTHMTDILRAAVPVHHDVAGEDILQDLRNVSFVFRGDDKTGSYAVAADVLLAVLQCSILGKHIYAGLSACIGSGAQIAGAGCHRADIDDGTAVFILLQIGQNTLGGIEGAAQVALKNRIPHFQCQLIHTAVFQADIGCIIHQNINLSVLLCGIGKQPVNALHRSDIHKMI